MKNSATELKVGLFVLLALAALAYMTTKISKGESSGADIYHVSVYFSNVSGLKTGAPVEVAGIEVGHVAAISLVQNQADVTLALRQGLRVYADSQVSIQTRGVLGDKFVVISPGTNASPEIKAGGRIAHSYTPADMNALFDKVGQIADDLSLVAKSFANSLGGPQGERELSEIVTNLKELTVGLNTMVQANMDGIASIVSNLKEFSADMKTISHDNKQGIQNIVANLDQASVRINAVLANLEDRQTTLGRLMTDKKMGAELKATMASLTNISKKIDEGRGSLGRLVNDEATVEELNQALKGVNKFLAKQDRFHTDVDFSSEIYSTGDVKSYFSVKLSPAQDKFYMLSVNNDPKGRRERQRTEKETWTNGVYGQYVEEKTVTNKDDLKFSLQLGRRWDDFVLRGGIIESTGGIGADYYVWKDRIKLSTEFFDFTDDHDPHWKAGGKLFFRKNFYINAGLDDILGGSDNRSFFAGAGLYFSDEDLKYLIGSVPLPK